MTGMLSYQILKYLEGGDDLACCSIQVLECNSFLAIIIISFVKLEEVFRLVAESKLDSLFEAKSLLFCFKLPSCSWHLSLN